MDCLVECCMLEVAAFHGSIDLPGREGRNAYRIVETYPSLVKVERLVRRLQIILDVENI